VDGDDEFREFVAARWVSLSRLACLLTGSRADGKVLLQQCLQKAYLRWPSVAESGLPDAEVRRLMVHALFAGRRRAAWQRQALRRIRREQAFEPLEPLEAALLDRELVWPIVCSLPDRQRAVVVLRYYEGLDEREIADLLGCSVSAVKSQTHEAAAALRRGMLALQALGRIEDEP
jgi:RNA polymerase sigma factor (sigma-70 family)